MMLLLLMKFLLLITVNGRQIGKGDIPGKITKRLQDAFIDSIGFDYVNQYLQHLSA